MPKDEFSDAEEVTGWQEEGSVVKAQRCCDQPLFFAGILESSFDKKRIVAACAICGTELVIKP